MNTRPLDYILSTLLIGVMVAAAWAIVFFLVRPISLWVLAEYHVVLDFFVLLMLYGVFSGIAARLMQKWGPPMEGEYGMDHRIFTFWKLMTVVIRLGKCSLLPFTNVFVRSAIERLFGARLGDNVVLGDGVDIDDPYMITIGEDTVVGNRTLITADYVFKGRMFIVPVRIGKGVTIGVNTAIFPGVEIGDNAIIHLGSVVMPGTKVPAGETWRGNPARKWV